MYNYDRNIIVTAYRASHPDDLDPKERTLQQFDGDLFARFDAELRSQAPGMGIPVDDFSCSMLVFFASQSTAKTVRTQVSHACRYFDSVRPQRSVTTVAGTRDTEPPGSL
jgi:hypothetical protein